MPNEDQTTENVLSQVQSSGNQNSDNDNVWNKQLGGETGKNLRKNNMVRRVGLGLALLIFAGAFLALGAAVGAELLENESKGLVDEPAPPSDEQDGGGSLDEENEQEGSDSIDAVVEETDSLSDCGIETYTNDNYPNFSFEYDGCELTLNEESVENPGEYEGATFTTNNTVITLKESDNEISPELKIDIREVTLWGLGGPSNCYDSDIVQVTDNLIRSNDTELWPNPLNATYTYSINFKLYDPQDESIGPIDYIEDNANVCRTPGPPQVTKSVKLYKDIYAGLENPPVRPELENLSAFVNIGIVDGQSIDADLLESFDSIVAQIFNG